MHSIVQVFQNFLFLRDFSDNLNKILNVNTMISPEGEWNTNLRN